MMTPEENDLLCRVEGDAPMGQIMPDYRQAFSFLAMQCGPRCRLSAPVKHEGWVTRTSAIGP